jgi:hypothetical protein
MPWKHILVFLIVITAMISLTVLIGYTDFLHDEKRLNRNPGYAEIILCGRETLAMMAILVCFSVGFLALFANFRLNYPLLIIFGLLAITSWSMACPFETGEVPPV